MGLISTIYHDKEISWFAGYDGLLAYNSKIFGNQNTHFHVLIRNVLINHDSVIFAGTYSNHLGYYANHQSASQIPELEYKYNSVEFQFEAVNVHNTEKIMYSYFLEGFNDKWSNWTYDIKKEYTNLHQGKYKFYVKAKNIKGNYSYVASYSFQVLPPWYQTTLAYIAYVLGFVSIVAAINFITVKRLNAAKQRLEKMVKDRTFEVLIKNRELETQRNEIVQKNKDLTDGINYAQRIQQSVMPELHEINLHLPNNFILFKPRDIVSGDFYWFAEVVEEINGQKKSLLIIAAADCTGHGVSGALMSVMGASILNEVVVQIKVTKPSEILNQLNLKLRKGLKQEREDAITRDGMDIALCCLDKETNLLTFSGAMRPCYIYRNHELIELKSNKFAIGGLMMEGELSFEQHEFMLEKGDVVYLSSDGYPSQFGGVDFKKLTTKRFKNILSAICKLPFNEQKIELQLEYEDWQGDQEQVDDVLVIGFGL